MTQRMVKVQNMVNKTISIKKPEYQINKRWTQKNQVILIPFDTLEQMLWNEGIRKFFDRGILYISEMKDKIDLGLEPEGAVEPQNIIVLNDTQIKELLTTKPFLVFKKEIENLSGTQVSEIVNYAITHDIADVEKSNYLKKVTGVDILRAITRNQDVKESESK